MKNVVLVIGFVAAFVLGACDSDPAVDDGGVRDTSGEGGAGDASADVVSDASNVVAGDGSQDSDAQVTWGDVTSDDAVSADTDEEPAGDTADAGQETSMSADVVSGSDNVASADSAMDTLDTSGDTTVTDIAGADDLIVDSAGVEEVVGDTDMAAVEVDTADTFVDTAASTDAVISDTDVDTDSVELTDTAEDSDAAPCIPTLVINEVDYDVPGKDTSEFVELYNPTACDMPISGIVLILVNGSNMTEYRRIALSDAGVDTVAADSYLLIHGEALVTAIDVPAVVMTLSNGFIQNGPDGLALFDEATLTVLDTFCYEAAMTEVWFDNVEVSFSLVEGEINPELADSGAEGVSVSRISNGVDSQNSAADWAVSTATPGAANVLQ